MSFGVVGSVADGDDLPGDLDVVVEDRDQLLEHLLETLSVLGGSSRMSPALPTVSQLRRARLWHFDTPDARLDVFIEHAGAVD